MKIGISNLDHIVPIVKIIMRYESVMDKDIETQMEILDVGCGKGVFGYILRSLYGWNKLDLTGVDPYLPHGFDKCLTFIYNRVAKMDIQKYLEINHRVFSIVLANHVMEHLKKDEAFLAIKRLKMLADLVLIGMPKARLNQEYTYANGTDYHTHKWGCMDPDFWDLGFNHANTIKDNMLFWWAREDLKSHFMYLDTSGGGLF